MKKLIFKLIRAYNIGMKTMNDTYYRDTIIATQNEIKKRPRRTEILNYLLSLSDTKMYLEIGVRNPIKNFNDINSELKYSVDPGIEFEENPVDFNLTSDEFFFNLELGKLKLPSDIKFDVIFIDGLHLAEQVERDIKNALKFIKHSGFVVLHDCNPPSEFHQRENYYYFNSPAHTFWNGTTWKAFYKYRHSKDLFSICFDTDWGIGVLSKSKRQLFNNLSHIENPYFEYSILEKNKKVHLNLYSFDVWKGLILNHNKM